jgi:hypothetical protein
MHKTVKSLYRPKGEPTGLLLPENVMASEPNEPVRDKIAVNMAISSEQNAGYRVSVGFISRTGYRRLLLALFRRHQNTVERVHRCIRSRTFLSMAFHF